MNRASLLRVLCAGLLAVLAALCVTSAHVTAGHKLSVSYKVAEATVVGEEVRVSLQIRLTNNTGDELSVNKAALLSFLPRPRGPEQDMFLLLPPHKSALVTKQFLVARAEFEQWEKGAPPRLFLRLRTADGQEITQTVQLLPGQAAPMGVE